MADISPYRRTEVLRTPPPTTDPVLSSIHPSIPIARTNIHVTNVAIGWFEPLHSIVLGQRYLARPARYISTGLQWHITFSTPNPAFATHVRNMVLFLLQRSIQLPRERTRSAKCQVPCLESLRCARNSQGEDEKCPLPTAHCTLHRSVEYSHYGKELGIRWTPRRRTPRPRAVERIESLKALPAHCLLTHPCPSFLFLLALFGYIRSQPFRSSTSCSLPRVRR